MKIRAEFEITVSVIQKVVDLSEYGVTDEEWNDMSEDEQNDWLFDNVLDRMEQPSWDVCSKDEV
jgi:hypothetical protein